MNYQGEGKLVGVAHNQKKNEQWEWTSKNSRSRTGLLTQAIHRACCTHPEKGETRGGERNIDKKQEVFLARGPYHKEKG